MQQQLRKLSAEVDGVRQQAAGAETIAAAAQAAASAPCDAPNIADLSLWVDELQATTAATAPNPRCRV
jgi:hypothetical protein